MTDNWQPIETAPKDEALKAFADHHNHVAGFGKEDFHRAAEAYDEME